MYVETAELRYHRASVDLAHVTIPIGLLQLANVQTPRAVDDFLRGRLAASGHPRDTGGCTGGPEACPAFVSDRDTRIMRHDSGVNRENRLIRGAQPANLESRATRRNASVIDGISLCSVWDGVLFPSDQTYTEKKLRAEVVETSCKVITRKYKLNRVR